MPFLSPSACARAWPSAMPASSVVWCWSTCRSPVAVTVRSMSACRAKSSSMWSRKPTPVAISAFPVPSSVRLTVTSVSAVRRLTIPARMGFIILCGVRPRLLSSRAPKRHRRWNPAAEPLSQDVPWSPQALADDTPPRMHATTILMVRKGGRVVIGGDGQVSLGQTIVKGNARKVRRLAKGEVIGGFAGSTADAFTLFERLETKLDQYPGQLTRACVELTKDWRTDRYLRRLEAMMLVADREVGLLLSGGGDVLEPETGPYGSVM